MIILGIDPGTASTGWGAIKIVKIKNKKEKRNGLRCLSYGCIKTPMGMVMPKRLLLLRKELRKIISFYKPDCLATEQLFFGANSKTAMSVGQARGVVMVTAAESNLPLLNTKGCRLNLL